MNHFVSNEQHQRLMDELARINDSLLDILEQMRAPKRAENQKPESSVSESSEEQQQQQRAPSMELLDESSGDGYAQRKRDNDDDADDDAAAEAPSPPVDRRRLRQKKAEAPTAESGNPGALELEILFERIDPTLIDTEHTPKDPLDQNLFVAMMLDLREHGFGYVVSKTALFTRCYLPLLAKYYFRNWKQSGRSLLCLLMATCVDPRMEENELLTELSLGYAMPGAGKRVCTVCGSNARCTSTLYVIGEPYPVERKCERALYALTRLLIQMRTAAYTPAKAVDYKVQFTEFLEHAKEFMNATKY